MRHSRPPAPPPAPTEDTPFGRFTLKERIAVGGMAEIFRAEEPRAAGAPRMVVIKRMLPHIAAERGAARMFEEEARLAKLVEHLNVARVFEFGEADGQPYLSLELVMGMDLGAVMRWLSHIGASLPLEVAIFCASELLAGLHAVHEATDENDRPLGIVHGDVSPSNVLVSTKGEVKLADFGIAEARLRSSFPQAAASGRTKGKLGYLAPEQVRGEPTDRRADIFAAAVVTTELILGQPLFERGSELTILLAVRDAKIDRLLAREDELPAGLLTVLTTGLARDPGERYESAAEFRMALGTFLVPPATYRDDLGHVVARAAGVRWEDVPEPPIEDIITMEPPLDDYTVQRADGQSQGPMTFAQLVEAVTRGDVGTGDEVRLGGGRARPLREIGELAGHLPARDDRTAQRVPMGGAFVDHLARSAASRASGVWTCRRGELRKDVYLIDGAPEFVSSNLTTELLGEFLVEREVLSRAELDMALAVLPRFEGRLGDTLTALGLVEPVELFQHIAAQVREKLLELFLWTDGVASFQEGVPPPQRYFPLGLDPWRIVSEGIQRRIEAGLEQGTFSAHMLGVVGRTPVDAPHNLPNEVRHLLERTRRPALLQEVVDFLEDPAEADVHRPYRVIRLALALDLIRFT